MKRINRMIFSIIDVALLILSCGLCCHANPVGTSTNCVQLGSASCDVLAAYGFVFAGADAIAPGDPNLPASADASAQANDTLTFFGPGGHAFVEFQFVEIIFAADGGGASAGATANGQSLLGSPFAITFGVPFSFDMSVSAAEDLSGDVEQGHDEESVGELQLTDILVVNAGGHPLRNIHFTSGSGTLYPLDAANILPSPEPPSLWLFGFGLISLVFAASRPEGQKANSG